MADLEDRLRDALRARARAVEPDPRAWRRVESRIRRRRTLVWAAPATAVAAVAAAVALALPALLPGQDDGIEFGPADDPTEEPEPDGSDDGDIEALVEVEAVAVPELEGRVAGIAWADGEVHVLQTPEGQLIGHGALGPAAGLVIAPGSDFQRFAVAAGAVDSDGSCLGGASYHVRADGSHFSADSVSDCATPPRFSPDGDYVARVVRDGTPAIDIRAFGAQGTDADAAVTAEVEGARGDLEVVAWLAGPEGSEVLYLLDRGDGQSGLHPITVRGGEGSPDGEGLALPPAIVLDEQPALDTEGWVVEAAAARSASAPRAHGLAMLQARDGTARLWAGGFDEDPPIVVPLPDELAQTGGRAWVFADGDDVLVGDGERAVWHVALDSAEPAPVELGVDWMTAALLPFEAGDPVEPDDSGDPDPGETDGDVITAFFVRSIDNRQWVEPATVPLHAPTVGVARAAMEALTGSAPGELDTMLPAGTRVLGVSIDDGVLKIDLSEHVAQGGLGSEAEEMLAQQLAHTAAQFTGVEAVRLLVQGSEISELWGHLDWSEPIEPNDLSLSPVVISAVTVEDGRVTASGEATVYEATVEIALIDPSGQPVEDTFTTASCGGPCRGEWTHTFEVSAGQPGTWRVQAGAPRVTEEGPPPFQVTAEVMVD